MGTRATGPKFPNSGSEAMKTYNVAYQVAASSERAELLEGWVERPAPICSRNYSDTCRRGNSLYIAEVTDSAAGLGTLGRAEYAQPQTMR
jgi:hypothetical protein